MVTCLTVLLESDHRIRDEAEKPATSIPAFAKCFGRGRDRKESRSIRKGADGQGFRGGVGFGLNGKIALAKLKDRELDQSRHQDSEKNRAEIVIGCIGSPIK